MFITHTMRKNLLLFILLCCMPAIAAAQADSLMDMLNSGTDKGTRKEPVIATFKATRIIDGPSVENLGMGVLDFRICHRFGALNQGAQNTFGIDDATTFLGLDYGITSWLMVGVGHSVLNKEENGTLKIKLLRQRREGMPVTVSYAGEMSVQNHTCTFASRFHRQVVFQQPPVLYPPIAGSPQIQQPAVVTANAYGSTL